MAAGGFPGILGSTVPIQEKIPWNSPRLVPVASLGSFRGSVWKHITAKVILRLEVRVKGFAWLSLAQCNIDLLCSTLLFYQRALRPLQENHNRKAIYIHCRPLASNPNSHHSLILKHELLIFLRLQLSLLKPTVPWPLSGQWHCLWEGAVLLVSACAAWGQAAAQSITYHVPCDGARVLLWHLPLHAERCAVQWIQPNIQRRPQPLC